MKAIDYEVVESVLATLNSQQLFRYDCNRPEECLVSLFEKKFADYLGFKYVIAMSSCSSALFVSLLCCGLKPGDKVLMPAFTFIAVPSAVVHAGAQPVLVEVDDQYVIDCQDLEKKITSETKHLLLSHMRGRIADMDRVVDICKKNGITLIEDTAHSLAVLWRGIPTGKFGKVAAYSTQSYKMIDGGEGGILATDDKEIAMKAMLYSGCYESNWMKHFFPDPNREEFEKLVNTIPAYNFRMSNLTAAALLPQIDKIEARVKHYNENYRLMKSMLKECKNITVPEFPENVRPAADSIQFRIEGLSEKILRDFLNDIKAQGINLSIIGLSKFNARCFWQWTFFKHLYDCPKTKNLLMNTVDMRLFLKYTPLDIKRIGGAIISTLKKYS